MSGGGQTSTSSQAPPQQYLDAYSSVLQRANQNASTPYQQYPGSLQAGFSPLQQQGFNTVAGASGVQAPYLNAAAGDFTNSTANLQTAAQPYEDEAQGQFGAAASANLPGAVEPWQAAAATGFNGGSQAIDPTQYSGSAIQGFESPYTQQVVNATQAQFNDQNAQAATRLQGNAASQGALGGDRLGVAQAQLAGQQQTAQAPVIAGLENTGFNQAQQEFNNQQGVNLSAQQNTASRQLQAAQGFEGIGSQSLTAAQQQAAIQQQAGTGFAGLGQEQLSAGQAQGWLNAQAGSGLAGLGNEALSGTLQTGSADLSAGGQEQAQAQTGLNIPYQQWQAALAYPYQQTGWLSNIAQGLGSSSGTVGSSTTPNGSTLGQVAGLGIAGAGIYGATGGFNSGSGFLGDESSALSEGTASVNRGGRIGFAGGGGVPNLSVNGIPTSTATPGALDLTSGFAGNTPDASVSVIPSGGSTGGTPAIKRNYGTTTTSSGGGSPFETLLNAGAATAANIYAPGSGALVGAGLNVIEHNRGGQVGFARAPGGYVPVLPRGFAAGGAPPISVSTVTNAAGKGVPTMMVNPSGGSAGDDLNSYLSTTAAGAYHPAAPAPAAPAAPAAGGAAPGGAAPGGAGSLTGDQVNQLQSFLAMENNQGNAQTALNGSPGFRGGGVRHIRGFADGGDTGGDTGSVDDLGRPVPMMTPDPQPSDLDRLYRPSWSDILNAGPDGPQSSLGLGRGAGSHEDTTGFGRGAGAHSVDDVEDTIGFGRGAGAHTADLAASPDDDSTLPVPPIPPGENSAGPSGFAKPVQPTPGTAGAPAIPDGPPSGGAPPGAPPTSVAPRGGFGDAPSSDTSGSSLANNKANPWLALATAGFGMAASRSPHALQALGEGAGAGLNEYVSADKAAKDLAARVDENRARLKETQAWHDSTAGINQQKADTLQQRANTSAAAQQARAAYLQNQVDNPKMTTAQLRSQTIASLTQQVNPNTGVNWTPDEAFAHTANFDALNQQRSQRIAETGRHNQANEANTATLTDARVANYRNTAAYQQGLLALKAEGNDDARAKDIMDNATRQVIGDPSGKTKLDDARKQQTQGRAALPGAAAQSAAPAAPAVPPPMPPGVPPGSQYSPSRQIWRDPAGKLYDAKGAPAP